MLIGIVLLGFVPLVAAIDWRTVEGKVFTIFIAGLGLTFCLIDLIVN